MVVVLVEEVVVLVVDGGEAEVALQGEVVSEADHLRVEEAEHLEEGSLQRHILLWFSL